VMAVTTEGLGIPSESFVQRTERVDSPSESGHLDGDERLVQPAVV